MESDVAFNSDNNVEYISIRDGLSIGSILNVNYNEKNVSYEKLNNGLYSLNNLTLNLNFPLTIITGQSEDPNGNNYIRIVLEDKVNNNIFGYYITWNGKNPKNISKFNQMQDTSTANNGNLNINIENIIGKYGLAPNSQFILKISYGRDENNQLITN